MAFCSSCGTEITAGVNFCPKCGKGASADAGGGGAGGGPAKVGSLPIPVAAALCYAFGIISGVVFLVLEPFSKDRLIRFHAFQSIFFSIASMVAPTAVSFVPFVGWVVGPMLGLASVVLWVVLIVKAVQGAKFKLPVIGDYAEQAAG